MINRLTIFIVSALAVAGIAAGCATGVETVTPERSSIETASGEREIPLANDGFDMTAYFALGKAVRGTPQLSLVWNGAKYLFASEEHRRSFSETPEKYQPGFAGHCPVSLAQGREIDGDPSAWRIFRDRLYFFINEGAAEEFDRDPAGIVSKAERSRK